MDFWEGFFLGKFWTDSNYRNKKHVAFHIWLGILCGLPSIAFIAFPSLFNRIFVLNIGLRLIFFLLLFIFLPPIAGVYWKIPPITKPLVLAAYALQYYFLLSGILHYAVTKIQIDIKTLPEALLDISNKQMTALTDFLNFGSGLTATLISFVAALIIAALIVILAIVAVCCLPPLAVIAVKLLQRCEDYLWYRYFYKRSEYVFLDDAEVIAERKREEREPIIRDSEKNRDAYFDNKPAIAEKRPLAAQARKAGRPVREMRGDGQRQTKGQARPYDNRNNREDPRAREARRTRDVRYEKEAEAAYRANARVDDRRMNGSAAYHESGDGYVETRHKNKSRPGAKQNQMREHYEKRGSFAGKGAERNYRDYRSNRN